MAEWQPIESAPKDGTYIIVWPPTYEGVASCAKWDEQKHHKKPKPHWRRLDATHVWQSRIRTPTHWQPLPEPPKD